MEAESGEIKLFIDKEEERYEVCWYGHCGYSCVTYRFECADHAEDFHRALTQVIEVEAD